MPPLLDWLENELSSAPVAPMTRAELEQTFGGRPALARQIAGIPPGRLPAKGTPERRRYETAMRALQRPERAGQINPRTGRLYQARRGIGGATGQRIAAIGRARQREAELRRVGGTIARFQAEVSVNGYPPRERVFGPVEILTSDWAAIFDALAAGRTTEAEGILELRLTESKGLYRGYSHFTTGIATAEIGDVTGGSIE
jgi:hypothetical protein